MFVSRAKSGLFSSRCGSHKQYPTFPSLPFSLHHLKKCDTLCLPTWHNLPSNKRKRGPRSFSPQLTHKTNTARALRRERTQYTQPTQRGQTHPQ
ncbi:uncharacterized protein LY79DRAFT_380694 [Colletotrichum navitas]|uniref:Uncharacterized protein n=1 Tax=Colletotrichum navitas TaxID=681940 RepID=A0AAD8V7N3_9PEZI|nr:uncharacterized protein LY79DRAFT_380694 [Colletotrichum navitas]KAK1597302.1 hypothetical protein LY79DRAFT_380694 [Colletotrichum navitas]